MSTTNKCSRRDRTERAGRAITSRGPLGSRIGPVRLKPQVLFDKGVPGAWPEHDLTGPAAAPIPVAFRITTIEIGEFTYVVARAPLVLEASLPACQARASRRRI